MNLWLHILQSTVTGGVFVWCLRWAAPVIKEVLTYDSEGEN